MQSPEAFMLKFFEARNAVFRRQQKELETFQKEFCLGSLIYDKRLAGYQEERVLEVVAECGKTDVITNGNIKGRNASRLRYELTAADGTWLVSDLRIECPICRGTGKFKCSGPACDTQGAPDTCKVCKGSGWISTKEGVEGLLDEPR